MTTTDEQIEADEHRELVAKAGCGHPAVYEINGDLMLGWCARCRAVAFGGQRDDPRFES
jgi:hypothetical protein